MESFIAGLPKAELHLHIEGSFEPELMFAISKRNKISLPYRNIVDLKQAYQFSNLQEFLNIYYAGMAVLQTRQDFYDLTFAYFTKAKKQNIVHAEIFFDPQAHTSRGVAFESVILGMADAAREAEKSLNISSRIIMCFLRDQPLSSAEETLETALSYRSEIYGVGLDSAEKNYPPQLFKTIFVKAKAAGFARVAHAGEEGPSDYIWEALDELKVQRIDHGIRCLEDPELIKILAERQIPLTLCPLSNMQLKVFKNWDDYPICQLLDKNILVTINSDDPAYFRGYVNENYLAIAKHFDLSYENIYQLASNSFKASFISNERKTHFQNQLDKYYEEAIKALR